MVPVRLFTLADANRTLPLVARIVAEVRDAHGEWQRALGRYELLSGGARVPDGETPELIDARTTVRGCAQRVDGCLDELEAIGCVFKGFDQGLVDFPSLRDDRPVFLCWKLGEQRVEFWHEVDEGYGSRHPIDGAILNEADV